MTHCSFGNVVWKSRRIVGIATLSTVVSKAAMSTAERMMTSVIQRRGSSVAGSVRVRPIMPYSSGADDGDRTAARRPPPSRGDGGVRDADAALGVGAVARELAWQIQVPDATARLERSVVEQRERHHPGDLELIAIRVLGVERL